ncbi:MAG: methyltransferase domain-containing protein [Terriglobales bacterium]
MKKPVLRVTKWLKDIPVEGACTSCADSQFKVTSASHRPNREEYQKLLQREFDGHVKAVHEPKNTQEWKADRYAEHAHFVPALGQAVLDLLNPRPEERILDLGCGDGVLSEKIKAAGATVVGVDASEDMIAAAKARGIDARVMDGFNLAFDAEFDAAFSNAALHWMKRDPSAVVSGVRRALKPGGRFAGEMGGHGNVAAITVALLAVLERHGVSNAAASSPWYFPTVDDYRARLEQGGFVVEYIELIPRPTPLPTDMTGWLKTFGMPLIKVLPQEDQSAALNEAMELLRPALCDEKGRWTADYIRLRFLARAGN